MNGDLLHFKLQVNKLAYEELICQIKEQQVTFDQAAQHLRHLHEKFRYKAHGQPTTSQSSEGSRPYAPVARKSSHGS